MTQARDFYTYMQYPIPDPIDFFASHKIDTQKKTIQWTYQNPHTHIYVEKINKYGRLYKSIPFIKAIYVCDSISFNATTSTSDIDLFFVVEDRHIWRARLMSVLLFWILGLKRSLHHKTGKFDLIFYITQSHTNIKNICISPQDPYLYHWLAHLIPLYTEDKNYNIYKYNIWIYDIFPNIPKYTHVVDVGIQHYYGRSIYKSICEYSMRWKWIEKIIKRIRKYSIIQKMKKRNHKPQDIIITDNILKFHQDRRNDIANALKNK